VNQFEAEEKVAQPVLAIGLRLAVVFGDFVFDEIIVRDAELQVVLVMKSGCGRAELVEIPKELRRG